MKGALIKFDSVDGLIFCHLSGKDGDETHRVSIKKLKKMSLRQLEHTVLANILLDLPDLQEYFADYLWSKGGEVPPKLREDQERCK